MGEPCINSEGFNHEWAERKLQKIHIASSWLYQPCSTTVIPSDLEVVIEMHFGSLYLKLVHKFYFSFWVMQSYLRN